MGVLPQRTRRSQRGGREKNAKERSLDEEKKIGLEVLTALAIHDQTPDALSELSDVEIDQ